MKKITINLSHLSYDIRIENGILSKINQYYNLQNKVMILSDTIVPSKYIQTLQQQCSTSFLFITPSGEEAKSLQIYTNIINFLIENQFSRQDLIIALGGGVIGDLAGFVASTYKRGIDYIGIPTTSLSQIDSSIGGKVALNHLGIKNVLGSFYHPKAVFIDPMVLQTLPKKHFYNGIVEAIKIGAILSESLFNLIKNQDLYQNYETILFEALLLKKEIVEQDEKELHLRKILNFGHTIGHALESTYPTQLLHGEAVALGMYMITDSIFLKKQLQEVLQKIHMNLDFPYDEVLIYQKILNDKKRISQGIEIIQISAIGTYTIECMENKKILEIIRRSQHGE